MNSKYLIDLILAGLSGDSPKVETVALTFARSLKRDNPILADELNNAISSFIISSGSTMRGYGANPLPIDKESQLDMVTMFPPSIESPLPILPSNITEKVANFLEEQAKLELLLSNGVTPSRSLLLVGPPGTGKTMLARHIASALNKNLLVLDLSSSLSSLMGKTGTNIKKVLDYAKKNSCVLLFDEFDAIAKKRDDNSDLGEIKRVVNVLLMELEDWPVSSLFIGTSNHPELLDKAIWRRFDHHIDIPIPSKFETKAILHSELDEFITSFKRSTNILDPLSELFEGKSAADLCKYGNNVKRRVLIKNEDPYLALIKEIEFDDDKKTRAKFCKVAKDYLGDNITIRELAEMTGLSPSGVQHHLG